MRNNGMDWLVFVKSQQQGAWIRLVFRIISDNFTIYNDLSSYFWIYPALKHTLEGMSGEMQSCTVHSIIKSH